MEVRQVVPITLEDIYHNITVNDMLNIFSMILNFNKGDISITSRLYIMKKPSWDFKLWVYPHKVILEHSTFVRNLLTFDTHIKLWDTDEFIRGYLQCK